jgi:hypothetical protein
MVTNSDFFNSLLRGPCHDQLSRPPQNPIFTSCSAEKGSFTRSHSIEETIHSAVARAVMGVSYFRALAQHDVCLVKYQNRFTIGDAPENATGILFGLAALFTDDHQKLDPREEQESRNTGTFAWVNHRGFAMMRIKAAPIFV